MIRAVFTPPWVAMSEAALPKTWADARTIILANSPWILLLAAVERAFEGHYRQAGLALLGCIAALAIAVHWNAFEGLGRPEGRKRLAFILIAIGAACLAAGIYLLSTQLASPDLTGSAQREADLQSRLDTALTERDRAVQAQETLRLAVEEQNKRIFGGLVRPQSRSVPGQTRIETLSAEQTRELLGELYALKTILPQIWISSGPAPHSHDLSVFSNIFARAGIQVSTAIQQTEGPDQTGLMICVPDINLIPEKARKLAEILGKFGIETKFVVLSLATLNSTLPPEVGFTLFIGPKSL